MYSFKLPDLGEGIHEGEILKWYIGVDDRIDEDAPLVEVETDKAAVTIPSPRAGRIITLTGAVGDTITTGQTIVTIDDGTGVETAEAPPVEPAKARADQAEEGLTKPQPPGRPRPAAPATRRLARELGLDINQVTPTGPGGRVTPEDLRAHAEGGTTTRPTPSPSEEVAQAEFASHAATTIPLLDLEPLPDFTKYGKVETEPLRSIRRKVARKMVTSMVLVPHVAHMDEADVTLIEEFRKRENSRRQDQGEHLTLLSFVLKAVTAGLKATPAFNASLDPFKEEIFYKHYYNLGIAVDTGRGLVVPVIRNTDQKSIIQISGDIAAVAGRAREGKLEAADMQGGTFTITNVGPLGGTALIPTINYPEVAILGMGRVQEKPVVREGEIVIRKILPLTLAFDHRIADGADAARFVGELVQHLSDPNRLLLET